MRPAVRAQFTGTTFALPPAEQASARRHYTPGDWYNIAEFEERSREEHGQFFAVLAEAWAQWPESDKENFRNVDQFRARTLIALNYCKRQPVPCDTIEEAIRWSRAVAGREPYSIVEVRGTVVMITTAETMRVERKPGDGGMPRKRFNAAKNACFEHWATVIGCTVDELLENSKLGRHKKAVAA